MNVLPQLKSGIKVEVRNGLSSKILDHNWAGIGELTVKDRIGGRGIRVKDLIAEGNRQWNEEALKLFIGEADCKRILKINSVDPESQDKFLWTFDTKGRFSVMIIEKSHALAKPECSRAVKMNKRARLRCWRIRAKGKIKHFIWKCFSGILPVSCNVVKGGVQVDVRSWGCGDEKETAKSHQVYDSPCSSSDL
ncbi:ribonuclease H-like superfamily protein [Striga asiatica]|uniref:Ribonuclease H-like superfamily protein n=1 Tax=Striga asiatica TaxID=4170 RepID=A0A5A7RIV2_STRAF|nr:ribonuclease H-like superfamily protein [Striga asiatica]